MPPYGYKKGPANKHHLLLDEDNAPNVRRMFEMRAQGLGFRAIALQLNAEGILPPGDLYYQKKGTADPRNVIHKWAETTVKVILRSEVLCKSKKNFSIIHIQEFDEVVCDLRVVHDFDMDNEIKILPNQYKNTLIAYDPKNELILYMLSHDYRQIADSNSVIIPPYVISQPDASCRRLSINRQETKVKICPIEYAGTVQSYIDDDSVQLRQKSWEKEYLEKHKLLISYTTGEHEQALDDIIQIINLLSWDLKEICIIGPYLQATDILLTAAQCNRQNIVINCICDYSVIHKKVRKKGLHKFCGFLNFLKRTQKTLCLSRHLRKANLTS